MAGVKVGGVADLGWLGAGCRRGGNGVGARCGCDLACGAQTMSILVLLIVDISIRQLERILDLKLL